MSSEIDTKCTPFVMQGYDNTLSSLTMKRPDHPLVQNVVVVDQERRQRPHVDAFADLIPIDEVGGAAQPPPPSTPFR